MSPILIPDIMSVLDEYLAALAGAVTCPDPAVYLTGSAALADWRPDRSDLDILVVVPRRLDDAELTALARVHAGLAGRPYRDAVYVERDAVGRSPEPGGPGFAHAVDGAFRPTGHQPDPVLWATLHRHGITVRGQAAGTLGADPDPRWLRDWNLGNLASYWLPRAAGARRRLAGRDPHSPLPADVVAWHALGPGRLHHTVAEGGIISKTGAADYTARRFPEHAGLLSRAKAWRLGDEGVGFTTADGLAACDLIEAVAADADRLRPV